jgi:diacylglycerol kinase (ATP)
MIAPADFLASRFRAFRYAAAGIVHLLRTQRNAQIHAVATVLVIAAGIALRLTPIEWCWMTVAAGGVWTAEAFNTALECLCDATCPYHHPLIGKAKDVAAASVLLAALTALAIAALVLTPRFAG